jgi:hypothetical protein
MKFNVWWLWQLSFNFFLIYTMTQQLHVQFQNYRCNFIINNNCINVGCCIKFFETCQKAQRILLVIRPLGKMLQHHLSMTVTCKPLVSVHASRWVSETQMYAWKVSLWTELLTELLENPNTNTYTSIRGKPHCRPSHEFAVDSERRCVTLKIKCKLFVLPQDENRWIFIIWPRGIQIWKWKYAIT